MGNEVGAMKKKGFTLIEVLLGLCLLGLISVTTLPILTTSLLNINKSKIKLEMNYIGEMSIERIKSFDKESPSEPYIFDKKVREIIEEFEDPGTSEVTLGQERNGENYRLKIIKEERNNRLWEIGVYVYHDKERGSLNHVEYKTYILKK